MPVHAHAAPAPAPAARDIRSRLAPTALGAVFDEHCGARLRSIQPGEEIFGEGEAADHVYRVVEGVVRTYHLLSDGRRQICDFLHPGDVLGPEAGLTHRNSADAVTAVVVQAIPRRTLAQLAQTDLVLTNELWRLSMDWFQRSQDHALILGRQGATERVVAFLLGYAERVGCDQALELPMTRQDIADYLGLTIHTVSRTMSQLQADGLIEFESLRRIRISRPSQLRAMNE